MGRMSVITEFWDFLRHRKKFWLLPLVLILLVLGVVIVLTANSALAPFIYTIF
jgi:competence protein ComGC